MIFLKRLSKRFSAISVMCDILVTERGEETASAKPFAALQRHRHRQRTYSFRSCGRVTRDAQQDDKTRRPSTVEHTTQMFPVCACRIRGISLVQENVFPDEKDRTGINSVCLNCSPKRDLKISKFDDEWFTIHHILLAS